MEDKKFTVILAEDEPDLMEIYSIALGEKFNLLLAVNGKKVLEILEEKRGAVDLIILDIVMPKMDGFDILRKLKKDSKYKNIPVVMSTNLSDPRDRDEAINLGAKKYFVKADRTPSELAEDIANILSEQK
ncbi:MAG: response regulator receiver protein [Parcubacteria group bacterium Athens0714_25]|nr:MAG: response regulator receiver protein [Parcubacteria group bacterium Athens0714_25]